MEKPKPECWGTVSNRLVRDENHARMWSGLTDEPEPRPLYTEAQLDAYTAELRAENDRLTMELAHEEQRVADMMADVNRAGHEVERLRAEAEADYSTLPGNYYMDPPDGGDVTPLEQLRRMAEDARRYRWLRAQHNPIDLPIAQVVWKRASGPYNDWVNMIDGNDLERHIDKAMEASNAG